MEVHAPGDQKWNCPQETQQTVLHADGWVQNEDQGPGPSLAAEVAAAAAAAAAVAAADLGIC